LPRPLRLRGGIASRDTACHERPPDEWIAIAVPSIIDDSLASDTKNTLGEGAIS
jgi:hypothetical protein